MSQLTMRYENGTATQAAATAGTDDLAAPTVAADPLRKVVEFFNNGSTTIYVSTSPTYATAAAAGRPVAPGESWSDAATFGAWYVFADTGTADVRITVVN